MHIEIRHDGTHWLVFVDGEQRGTFLSKDDAEAYAAGREPFDGERLEEAAPPAVTSQTLEERPFLVDGVALNEQQCDRVARLVAGTARPGGGIPLDLPAAIDLWKRQNHVRTLGSGRQVWAVHSASPTYRDTFKEAAALVESDPTGRVWDIVCIREGWSKNGRYYTRAALEAAVPLFEGLRVCAWGWDPRRADAGHLPEQVRQAVPGGLVLNEAGWVTSPRGRVAEDGRFEIVGTWECTDMPLASRLRETFARNPGQAPGFSIDGTGDVEHGVAEGRRGPIVHGIPTLNELTLVDNPAAGGRIERLVAGINPHEEETMYKTLRKRVLARCTESERSQVDKMEAGPLAAKGVEVLAEGIQDSALLGIVRKYIESQPTVAAELLDAYLAQLPEASEPDGDEQPELEAKPAESPAAIPAMEAIAAAEKRVLEAASKAEISECSLRLREALASSKLPEITVRKLQKAFDGKVFADNALREAIEEERAYLAAFDRDGNATGTSVKESRDMQIITEARDRYQASFDRLFGVKPESEKEKSLQESLGMPSLRRLYVEMTGDTQITGRVANEKLTEATTASLPDVLGNTLNRRMVQAYAEYPFYWEPFVEVAEGIDNFKNQIRPRMNSFSGLPTVAESDAVDYPDLGFPTDDQSVYVPFTHGGLVSLTRRMVMNDDLGQLRNMPQMLARAARHELNLFCGKLITGNYGGAGVNTDLLYDGLPIAHAHHRNLMSTALDFDAMDAARQMLEEQYVYGQKTYVNGFSNTTDPVQIGVTSSVGFQAGKLAICDGEIVRIVSVDDATHVTVARAQDGTAAAAHADGTALYQLGASIPLSKIYVLAATSNRTNVNRILHSERQPGTLNNDVNPYFGMAQSGQLADIVVPPQYLGGYRNNWFLVSDKKDIPMVEIGFINNRQEPEILLQDAPTVGYVFTRDVIRYKVRHEYGGVALDFRGIVMSLLGT